MRPIETICRVCRLLLDAIHCPWVTWHILTFYRSKSVDHKDFFLKNVWCTVTFDTYLTTRCPRRWMRTWTWKPCFRQFFIVLPVLLMFGWCSHGVGWVINCPWRGIFEWHILKMARHKRNGSRGWSTSSTQTWPDMAWHGRTALLENMSTQGSQFQRRTGESWKRIAFSPVWPKKVTEEIPWP